jgi:hypothetical protein
MDRRRSGDGAARDCIDSPGQGRRPAENILPVALAIYKAARGERAVRPESMR